MPPRTRRTTGKLDLGLGRLLELGSSASPFDVDVAHLLVTQIDVLQVHVGGFPDDAAQLIPAATALRLCQGSLPSSSLGKGEAPGWPPSMPTLMLPAGTREGSPQDSQQRKACQLLRTEHTGAPALGRLPGGAEVGVCTHTHLLGCLGLMLTGGPGGPSFLGKTSTHICTFP